VYRLPALDYREALRFQEELQDERARGARGDCLLLLTHAPVIAFARSEGRPYLLASDAKLREQGISVYPTNRGGGVTYHGPGQLCAYPILDLSAYGQDLPRYASMLEETVIDTLASIHIRAARRDGFLGVWIEDRKIATIGVAVRRWISSQGVAINLDPDLEPFEYILKCGDDCGTVTSIARELGPGGAVGMVDLMDRYVKSFEKVFRVGCVEGDLRREPWGRRWAADAI
jgi:lipoate-protein ligase B